MNSFTYQYPVKNYFGEGALHTALAAELPAMGEKVMLAYGGGSISVLALMTKSWRRFKMRGRPSWNSRASAPNPTMKVQEVLHCP